MTFRASVAVRVSGNLANRECAGFVGEDEIVFGFLAGVVSLSADPSRVVLRRLLETRLSALLLLPWLDPGKGESQSSLKGSKGEVFGK